MVFLMLTILSIIGVCVAPTIIEECSMEKDAKKKYRPYVWLAAVLVILVSGAFSTIRVISTGEVGVKTSFGVVSGRANEGFNFIAPWEKIIPMNTKIQKKSFTALSASTKDSQLISNISIDVNYKLNPEKAEEIYSTVGESYDETLISPLLTQFIKDRLALFDAEDLVTERNKIVEDLTSQLQNNLKDYGIDIVAVSLVNYDFSADFSSALERKAVAAKEIETAKNEQERAKVEAETNRIKSEQLTEAVLMDKLIDAIRNGNGTYIIDTNNLSIGVR
jgi:regulator of protease activity HflC (stomatin/prohibitin superfamily)